MRFALVTLGLLAACGDPTDTAVEQDPGTQIGEEGDDRRCVEVREEVAIDDTMHGDLDVSPAAFIALAEVPVSGDLPGSDDELTLTLTHTGRVWYAVDEPRDEDVDPTECTAQSYFAEVSGTLVAGDLLDESFTAEAWSFQQGHVYVGARFDLDALNGSITPERIDPSAWDEVTLHAFGGSTDGVWAFHLDWDAAMDEPGQSDREDIADLSLYPQAPMR